MKDSQSFIKAVDRLLIEKTGKRACELDYMELPDERERYNTRFTDGNIKTKKQADELIDKFLNSKLP